jgi:hypothetical protein
MVVERVRLSDVVTEPSRHATTVSKLDMCGGDCGGTDGRLLVLG